MLVFLVHTSRMLQVIPGHIWGCFVLNIENCVLYFVIVKHLRSKNANFSIIGSNVPKISMICFVLL